MTANERIDLAELRERTMRAHAWGGPGAIPASPEEVLALVEVVEAAQAVLAADTGAENPIRAALAKLYLTLARFDFGQST